MNLTRKTIARACVASLVGLASTSTLVQGQDAPMPELEQARSPEYSILEPLVPKPIRSNANRKDEGTSKTVKQSTGAKLRQNVRLASRQRLGVRHAAGSPMSIFEAVDNIAVSVATPQNSLVPVAFQTDEALTESLLNPTGDVIVVHPPTTLPAAPNRNYFRVENRSDSTAKNVVVQLELPAGAKAMEVKPYDTVVVGQTAIYRLREIGPKQSVTIELSTTPNSPTNIAFESRFTMDPLERIASRPAATIKASAAPAQPESRPVEVWSPKAPVRKTSAPISNAKSNDAQQPSPSATDRGANDIAAPQSIPETPAAPFRPQETNVISGAAARQAWEKKERLQYGETSLPGRVMVANPQLNAQATSAAAANVASDTEPFPRTPSAVALNEDVQEQNDNDSDNVAASSAAPNVESETLDPRTSDSIKPTKIQWKSQLTTRIAGPQHAVTGEEAEYEVIVENNSIKNAKDVIVQLSIPKGLEITVLDRNAWFDGKARKITWKLPAVDAGSMETIRYLAKVTSPDDQLQRVTLGVENKFRGQATFQSTIMDQYELAAPLMSFEKDGKSLK